MSQKYHQLCNIPSCHSCHFLTLAESVMWPVLVVHLHRLFTHTMGCVVCSQLVDMWTVRAWGTGRRAVDLTSCPRMLNGGYHRVTGLHYMSSFSDAEDCGDDSSSASSLTLDWQLQGADGWGSSRSLMAWSEMWCIYSENEGRCFYLFIYFFLICDIFINDIQIFYFNLRQMN